MVFFSIILPTYNRLYSLRQILLPGLEKQTFADYEIIVVDDGSIDGTEEYFSNREVEREFPKCGDRVVYTRNKTNIGAPASRNRGASLAKGDWIYIVEDDVEIASKQYLAKAKEVISGVGDDVAVVSPKREERLSRGYFKNPAGNFARVGLLSGEIYIDPTQEYSGFVPNTHASSFVRREVYNQFLEDERMFFGNTFRDESDLYLRIRKAGWKLYYAGDILKSVHRNDFAKQGGQKKVNKLSIFKQERMVIKNHYRYLRKNYGLVVAPVMTGFFTLGRMIKHSALILRVGAIKDLLAWIRF
ncbi:MAG: GalNAc(5)-diNAcBac-PP-undecaprenol beta-1,3-glucosyltransferase [bacterium ADurb.Bin400]|nr:MAG: GalNAc(5)-diNAcBac-PP-undecaprenol beta-1,3-glucosyltransferase [bacterium ADurb.Bin400]